MSADNWAICPKCKKIEEEKIRDRIKKADDAYGKVSKEEYEKLVFEANQTARMPQTMREDYEIGVDEDGVFKISYGCSCRNCNFTKQFKHEEYIDL